MKNLDVPGVIGHVGSVLGSNMIKIANFSLGRRDSGEPLEAIAVASTDSLVPQDVLDQLMSNPEVKLARSVDAKPPGCDSYRQTLGSKRISATCSQ